MVVRLNMQRTQAALTGRAKKATCEFLGQKSEHPIVTDSAMNATAFDKLRYPICARCSPNAPGP